ncbi:MAG: hypothetical protein LBM01_01975 [Christensenellaceae bacterium]|jgi:predicted GNAT family acetyltransferase|nr:hypothetical protein [Christensenellaceae bacterium]
MEFIRFNNLKSYRDAVIADLSKNEIRNSSEIQKISTWSEQEFVDANGLFAVVKDNGKNAAIIFHAPPKEFNLYFIDNKFNSTVAEFLIKSLVELNWKVEIVWADSETGLNFAKEYARITNQRYEQEETWFAYKLGKLQNVKKSDGKIRIATKNDSYFIPYWWREFGAESGVGTGDELDINNRINKFLKLKHDIVLFIDSDDIPVSMVGWKRISETLCRIGPVYTPPQFRRSGYATTAVCLLCEQLQTKYKDIMLLADADYPASNACYQKIGFERLFSMMQYKIGQS